MDEYIRILRMVATEFADVEDETVLKWVEITTPLISRKTFGKLYPQAIAFLTAHRMKMSGLGDISHGTVGDTLRVSNYSEGSTSIGFTVNQGTNLMIDAELALTPYGLEFLSLRRLVVTSIRISGESNESN